jgi:hypothetical protein
MKLRPLLLLATLAASPLAGAAPSGPPERVARLSYVEGEIAFEAAGERASSTLPDRPFNEDDRLATKADARAEVALGTAALRLDGRTSVRFDELGADRVRLRLEDGVANVTLRELQDGEAFEVVTPNTTLTLVMPGDYRVEVPSEESSIITVHGGAAQAETAGGPVRIADGQRVRLVGRESLASLETAHPADAFDDWVLQREVQLAEAEPTADQEQPELDRYGEWRDDPDYGRVWMPGYAYGGSDPFQYGYWQQVGFGWSWVDPYPWGPYTSYGGRWAYLHHLNRWCWTPPRHHPPVRTVQETHPFIRPRGGRGTIMPLDRDPPRAATSAPVATSAGAEPRTTPRVTPGKPRSGTFVPSLPRNPSPAPQSSTPATRSTSHPSGATMRPSGSSSSSGSKSSSSSSSTMIAPPTRP